MRRSERAFVAEGAKLLESALDAGASLEAVFHAPAATLSPSAAALLERAAAAGIRVHALAPGVIERVADTVTPQPLVCIAEALDVGLDEALDAALVLVLIDVRDPGNVGAILRSADASGAGAVILSAGTGDVYNPKAVRASAGSIFHVPLVVGVEPETVLASLRAAGFECVATLPEGGEDYASATLGPKVALVFGNEARGLPAGLGGAIGRSLSIPIEGDAESLNVAMAATVLCFELARRRRVSEPPGHSMTP